MISYYLHYLHNFGFFLLIIYIYFYSLVTDDLYLRVDETFLLAYVTLLVVCHTKVAKC